MLQSEKIAQGIAQPLMHYNYGYMHYLAQIIYLSVSLS